MNAKNIKKRPALGRGLSALVSSGAAKVKPEVENTKTIEVKKPRITVISGEDSSSKEVNENTIQHIAIDKIIPNPNQPRKEFKEVELNELSESIKELGVLQPILVKKEKDTFTIIAGERRWRASKLANLNEIPVILKDYTDRITMEVALVENIQRSNLSVIEEAKAYQALIDDFNISHDNLAKRVGKSRSNISNYIRLLNLPEEILSLVNTQALSMGHARALLTIKEPKVQKELARKCVEEKLSVREVEAIVSRKVSLPEENKNSHLISVKQKSKEFPEIVDEIRKLLGTKVTIKHDNKKGAGKIEIQYFSENELNRIVELLRN